MYSLEHRNLGKSYSKYWFLFPEKRFLLALKLKYIHMFVIVWGLQKEAEKRKVLLCGKQHIFRAFGFKVLTKTNLLFCGMTFCSFFVVVFCFLLTFYYERFQAYKNVERTKELYNKYTPPPRCYNLHLIAFALSHIHLYIHLSVPQSILCFMHFNVSCRHQNIFLQILQHACHK